MFKFIPYILKNLSGHRVRTLMTVGGAALLMFLFCFVSSIQQGLRTLTDPSRQDNRLILVLHKDIPPRDVVLLDYELEGEPIFESFAEAPREWSRPTDFQFDELDIVAEGDRPLYSQSIVFESEGKLKRADLKGNPPQEIRPWPGDIGGAWARDGTMIFGTLTSAIQRVDHAIPATMRPLKKQTPGCRPVRKCNRSQRNAPDAPSRCRP